MSLRDLSDQIGVSVNTLSRVERGHLPDLKNYQRLVEWLEVPADTFLEQSSAEDIPGTLDMVIRHFRSDSALTPAAVEKLTAVVSDMYSDLTSGQPRLVLQGQIPGHGSGAENIRAGRRTLDHASVPVVLAVHMRSAKTFTPAAGTLLAEMLGEMQRNLEADEKH